jgi:hypothetical protein
VPFASPARAGPDRDLEPAPPWIFFPTPDEEARRAIDALITNSYADFNKVGPAREAVVRRFHVWAVERLKTELTGPVNEPAQLNAILTVAALRGHVGAAPELAPLLRPLIEIARAGAEPWRRAFALLALGSFHGADGLGRKRQRADTLMPNDEVAAAHRTWQAEVPTLLRGALRDPNDRVRIAAALALGKTGGTQSRFDLLQGQLDKEASTDAQLAVILALGLLSEGAQFEQDRFTALLGESSTRVRAAAALAIALQAVSDAPPQWTTQGPERAFAALSSPRVDRKDVDGAEAIFALGCLAALAQRVDVWEDVLAAATTPSAEDIVATAAAQALMWCGDATVHARMLQHLTNSTKALKEPVLAAFLLRAGWDATPEGVRACRDWLGNAPRDPRADRAWDPRWHACVGLLRALSEGRPADLGERREVLAALEAAADRGLHREAPLLPELVNLIRTHKTFLLTNPGVLPEAALRAVEGAVHCRYHLLAVDLREMAIARANEMIYGVLFDLSAIRALQSGAAKDKDGSAKRFLEKHLAAWPYLSRLDVLVERGRRPPPALTYDDPAKVLDRR